MKTVLALKRNKMQNGAFNSQTAGPGIIHRCCQGSLVDPINLFKIPKA